MADIVLQAQHQYSAKFQETGIQAGKILDDLDPSNNYAAQYGFWRKRYCSATGSSSDAGDTKFVIPSQGLLLDIGIEVSLGATSGGNYSPNMATQYISNVKVEHGSNELHNYAYAPVYEYISSKWSNERKTRTQLASGGSASGSAVVGYTPLFAFFTSWRHPANDIPSPLPLVCCKGDVFVVTLTNRGVANILASGGSGGSLTSLRLVYWELVVDSSAIDVISKKMQSGKWKYFSMDWQTPSSSTVATATLTTLDLSGLQGDLKALAISVKLASDESTNHNYYINKAWTAGELKADDQSLYKFSTSNERIFDDLVFNKSKWGADSTNGVCDTIEFDRRSDDHSYSGSFPTSASKKLTLDVTHALGANANVYPCGVFNRYYIYRNGLFERIK